MKTNPQRGVTSSNPKICPKCGKEMQQKKRGGFWICRDYPDCKTLIPILTAEELLLKDKIQTLLNIFKERDQKILTLRFGIGSEPHTLDAIGKNLNLSRERIRQLEKRALRRLKHPAMIKKLQEGL